MSLDMQMQRKRVQYNILVEEELFNRVDRWRAKRIPIPSRPDAIRALLAEALEISEAS